MSECECEGGKDEGAGEEGTVWGGYLSFQTAAA